MKRTNSIVLAAGCFWCVEAIFSRIKGVVSVLPGYAGGKVSNPTYREVCSGKTGHAEVVKIEFIPEEIDLSELFAVFFATHDPTTLNKQGGDVGTQYRSAIFPTTKEQNRLALLAIDIVENSGEWDNEIVTTIEDFDEFYLAEDYHHNYFSKNAVTPYCNAVIEPKLQKFKSRFSDLLK
ncbi:MAG: peptide-methionine (S)-S-oxide reductase [Crocinitomicaceae bacterium]|nr:peptide-methionine (S)-S-oxide reductase [Crocinitomicaceae bacterium]|tara:strand:+ start:6719 stop:7255 length:537 start_codon:yes stop_codon:yes gene_type:complete